MREIILSSPLRKSRGCTGLHFRERIGLLLRGSSAAHPSGASALTVSPRVLIASKYVLFAAVATGCNLGFQAIADRAYSGPLAIYVSLGAGTLAGLLVKYPLDKHFIFYDETRGGARNSWLFVRYGLNGVLTTAVFWAFELGIYHAFHARLARYLGGALGLAVCYWLKYYLDKRLVFGRSRLQSHGPRGAAGPPKKARETQMRLPRSGTFTTSVALYLMAAFPLVGLAPIAFLPMCCVVGMIAVACYRFEIPKFPLVLFAVAFIVRLTLVLTIDTPIQSDFLAEYNAAQLFANGDMSFNQWPFFQVWGFDTGIVIYQGVLLKIWSAPLFLKIFNCLVTSGTTVLVYSIGKEIFSRKAAQCVGLCYAVFAFPAAFVTVLCNSHPSAFLTYLGIYVVVSKRADVWNWIVRYGLAAVLIALGNALRPDGVVAVAAVALCLLVAVVARHNLRSLLSYGKRLVIFVATYAVITVLLSQAVAWSGVNPVGLKNNDPLLKVVFGLNYKTFGGYSPDDLGLIAERMADRGISRSEAEMQIIKERLRVPPRQLLKLTQEKFIRLWWYSAMGWSLGHLRADHPRLSLAAEGSDRGMFLGVGLLAGIGGLSLLGRRKDRIRSWIVPFLVLITVLMHLVIEVQARYAYLAQIGLFVIAAGGIQAIVSAWRTGNQGLRALVKEECDG